MIQGNSIVSIFKISAVCGRRACNVCKKTSCYAISGAGTWLKSAAVEQELEMMKFSSDDGDIRGKDDDPTDEAEFLVQLKQLVYSSHVYICNAHSYC